MTLANNDPDNIHVFIVRLPSGAGLEIMAELATGMPDWFIAGLPGTADFVPPGRQGLAVIDLSPDLHLIARVTVPGQPPQVMQPFDVVTDETPSTAPAAEPPVDGEITMFDFGFGSEPDMASAPLPAGRHWWKVTNRGSSSTSSK